MLVLGDETDPDVGPEVDTVQPWPSGLDALGPDDGTATCVIIPRCGEVTVVDGTHALTFAWRWSLRVSPRVR